MTTTAQVAKGLRARAPLEKAKGGATSESRFYGCSPVHTCYTLLRAGHIDALCAVVCTTTLTLLRADAPLAVSAQCVQMEIDKRAQWLRFGVPIPARRDKPFHSLCDTAIRRSPARTVGGLTLNGARLCHARFLCTVHLVGSHLVALRLTAAEAVSPSAHYFHTSARS